MPTQNSVSYVLSLCELVSLKKFKLLFSKINLPDHGRSPSNLFIMQIKGLNRSIIAACLLGILVSTYALYVEMVAEMKPGYKALCDLSEHASCTKVLTSKYSKGLGLMPKDSPLKVPNCVYGIIFYSTILFLTTCDVRSVVKVQIGLSMTSLATCIYLAYLLMFVLHDFCLVCVTTYFINIVIAFMLNKKHNYLTAKNR